MSFIGWLLGRGGKKPGGSTHSASSSPSSISQDTLTDMVGGVQHALNSASAVSEQAHLRMLSRYIDEDGRLLTQDIHMPDGMVWKAPICALVPVSSMVLEEMRVDMTVEVVQTEVRRASPNDDDSADEGTTRSSFKVRVGQSREGRRGNEISLSMVFKKGDDPELVRRIIDDITNRSQPVPYDPDSDDTFSSSSSSGSAPVRLMSSSSVDDDDLIAGASSSSVSSESGDIITPFQD